MRLVYCGSGGFGLPTFDALVEDNHEFALVLTQPDRPAGRGGRIRETPIARRARALGIPLHQPETLRGNDEAVRRLAEARPELAVVVAYGHLIPPAMLEVPSKGFINLHASLLPKYRGAAPVPHAILEGETETGVTVFRLNERFDCGDILARRSTPITPEDTTATVLERLAPLGAQLVREVVGEFQAGWAQPVPQVDEEATSAPKLSKEDARIDWTRPRARIERMTRAFRPWPKAWTCVPADAGELRLVVLAAEPAAQSHREVAPGTVLHAGDRDGLVVQAGDGPLWLTRVQPEGGKPMDGDAFIRGHPVEPGTVLA
jgi:methionyl-tRNA formyltransferase